MDGLVWALIPITMFIAMGAGHALRGPLGKALADRIAGRAGRGEADERMHAELDELRQRVAELEERQDFAERVLQQQRASQRLEPGA